MLGMDTMEVTYLDGRPAETVVVGLGTLLQIENRWPAGAPPLNSLMFGAFVAMGNDPDCDSDFEKNYKEFTKAVGTIRSIREDSAADPTPPAATDD